MITMEQRRKYWGWGMEDTPIDHENLQRMVEKLKKQLNITALDKVEPIPLEDLKLRAPRFRLSQELHAFCSNETHARASHTYGKSFRDIWRGIHGQFDNPPDYVAFPKTEGEIAALMEFAQKSNISLIPYGGGSSVVGGVEPTLSPQYQGVITVDMLHFDQILAVDKVSRSARIQAGIYGPALESNLKPYGLTLRHFPQSFEFSTLGGWIATRSGGHFATLYTHIDEFIQSLRMITPQGVMQTRRLPGSGAGPSEERLLEGSEGIFGIITEAWMRLQDRPRYKLTVSVRFAQFKDAVTAARRVVQSGLHPSNARLIDPLESLNAGLGDGDHTMLILGFESHNHPLEPWMDRALEICKAHNGEWDAPEPLGKDAKQTTQSADNWKYSFIRAPYLRDELVCMGLVMETFETAVTWDQFDHFHKKVKQAVEEAVKKHCGQGTVTCRFTHIYPDGPAPYYSIIARGEKGKELEQWDQIKAVANDAVIKYGGTITHHHAVGKDHAPHYAQQHGLVFENILAGIKKTVDPQWILNPDVLLKPRK